MAEPFIGEIRMFGGNFEPYGWAFCDGRLLAIAQNSALFSLLGTTYGGNGSTNFALPDLRGRVPMSFGNGPGLTPRSLGEMSGTENVTLLSSQMPSHTHLVGATTTVPTGRPAPPTDNLPAAVSVNPSGTTVMIYGPAPANTTMSPAMIQPAGGNQPMPNMQPYTCVNFIIALQGIYPSRG